MKNTRFRIAVSFGVLSLCMVGCGQTGPLYLPQPEQPAVKHNSSVNSQSFSSKAQRFSSAAQNSSSKAADVVALEASSTSSSQASSAP